MQYCRACKVQIRGSHKCCPLCQRELEGEGDAEENMFPVIAGPRVNRYFLMRLITFIAVAAVVICLAVNYMAPTAVPWSLFASAGIACAWLVTVTGLSQLRNVFYNITIQLVLVSIFAVLWDKFTGWHNWSLEYAIPCLCLSSMISMFVVSKIMRVEVREYVVYLILSGIYGILPIVFILLDKVNVIYPSAICVAASVITIAAVLLFEGKNMREEFNKKFHI